MGGSPRGGHTSRLIKDAIRCVHKRRNGYGPLTEADREFYKKHAALLSAKHQTAVPPELLESVHGQERSLAARNRTSNPRRLRKKVWARRRKGEDALAIAAALDLPPLYVVKTIAQGSKRDDAVRPPTSAERAAAERMDMGSSYHQKRNRVYADQYEDEIAAVLDKLGATYRSEDDLRRAGMRLTPDFLLDRPLIINGSPVSWIDAKRFVYYGNPLTLAKLKKQAKKYSAAFGPGAMAFASGYARDAPSLGALLLGPKLE